MARFIGNSSLCEFKSGTCMVDLIKIGAVPPGRLGFARAASEQDRCRFQGVRLIQQGGGIGIQHGFRFSSGMGSDRSRNGIPFRVTEDDFVQFQADLFSLQADITAPEMDDIGFVVIVFQISVRILKRADRILPFPALSLGHKGGTVFGPCLSVRAVRQGKIKHTDLAEIEDPNIIMGLPEVKDDFLVDAGGGPSVLRGFCTSERCQADQAVKKCNHSENDGIFPVPVQLPVRMVIQRGPGRNRTGIRKDGRLSSRPVCIRSLKHPVTEQDGIDGSENIQDTETVCQCGGIRKQMAGF